MSGVTWQGNDINSGKDALNAPGSNTELMTTSIDDPKGSANNENLGASDGGSAPLEVGYVALLIYY